MKHRYLVTGGQGFVGRYLVNHLLSHSPDNPVLVVGRSPQQDSHFLHPLTRSGHHVLAPLPESLQAHNFAGYSYVSLDLSHQTFADLISGFHPTAIIHLAASLRGIADEFILQNNLGATESLLAAILKSRVKIEMFLLASTGGVYGKQESLPIKEDASPAPIDIYAKTKLACEEMVESFARRAGIPLAIARIFNVLGPGQDELHVAGRLASQIAPMVDAARPAVIRTRSLQSTRDFIDVRDVSTALEFIVKDRLEGIYNLGTGRETRIADLVSLFIQSAGPAAKIRVESECTTDPISRHVAGIGKMAALGFNSTYSLALSCCDMLQYYRRFIQLGTTAS